MDVNQQFENKEVKKCKRDIASKLFAVLIALVIVGSCTMLYIMRQ